MIARGFLIFAHNNEQHDYYKQAVWVADRIEHFLDKPVTIVTDIKSVNSRPAGHSVILTEPESRRGKRDMSAHSDANSSWATWKNANRNTAYNLTPYYETIVLDSDYIVNSHSQLNRLFDYPADFLCHRDVFDVVNKGSFDGDKTFGQFRMPHYWATVMYFKKSVFARVIFDNITMIKEHYKFYSELYKFNNNLFRNDYAVSIALLIAYGHRADAVQAIPWNLMTSSNDTKVVMNDSYQDYLFEYDTVSNGKTRHHGMSMSGIDLHCLDKVSLEEIIDAGNI